MGARWHHEVSEEWLKARKEVLTATDIANLVPEYKRSLKQKNPGILPGFAALWCAKHSDTLLDTESFNAAARGHVMEPYAVADWNRQMGETYYHWDDCIIINKDLGVGFSPDAMDIRQGILAPALYMDKGKLWINSKCGFVNMPESIMEIKCYEPPNHMKAVIEKYDEHKELMQLAIAFMVLPKLKSARLLWYCPGAPISMHSDVYARDDLKDQIKMATNIADLYKRTSDHFDAFVKRRTGLKASYTEEQIYLENMSQDDPMILR